MFETCGIKEAQGILHCCRNTIKKLMAEGKLRGAKIGRSWVFFKQDIYNVIKNADNDDACQRHETERNKSWHSTKEETFSGYLSQIQTEKELDCLLEQKTAVRRKSSLIN